MKLTFTEENYLKAIWKLETLGEKLSTNAISRELETRAPSVTDMLKKLSAKKLVSHSKYKSISLLPAGRKAAMQVVRKHRLWEVFLVEKLGFKWNEVHAIAEQLEHIDSSLLVDKLDDFLGNPVTDPHGDPIPDSFGNMRLRPFSKTLNTGEPGKKYVITGVKDSSDRFLDFLNQLGVKLGSVFKLLTVYDFEQSVEVETEDKKRLILNQQITQNLFVTQHRTK